MQTLSINGEVIEYAGPTNLLQLLTELGYQQERIAIAVNGEFVPRSQYGEQQTQDRDQIDIIRPVGGG